MDDYLAIRETTTAGQFAEAQKLGRTDPDKPTAVLLDLAHILPVSANVWLFKLLVVGAVRDNIGGNVYHRRRADHFYIEETGSEHFDGEWRVELQPQPEASSPSGHPNRNTNGVRQPVTLLGSARMTKGRARNLKMEGSLP